MGAILKQKILSGGHVKPQRLDLADVRDEAQAIVHEALREAEKIDAEAGRRLAEAGKEAEVIKKRAWEEGFAEGRAAGLEKGRAEGAAQALQEARERYTQGSLKLSDSLQNVLAALERERHELVSLAQQEILTLAIAIARKIVRREFAADPEAVLENVRTALEMIMDRTGVQIRMNPADLERLELLDPQKGTQYFRFDRIRFVADPRVEEGGCVIDTAGGEIDAQISTQIETIVRHFVPGRADRVERWSADAEAAEAARAAEEVTELVNQMNT